MWLFPCAVPACLPGVLGFGGQAAEHVGVAFLYRVGSLHGQRRLDEFVKQPRQVNAARAVVGVERVLVVARRGGFIFHLERFLHFDGQCERVEAAVAGHGDAAFEADVDVIKVLRNVLYVYARFNLTSVHFGLLQVSKERFGERQLQALRVPCCFGHVEVSHCYMLHSGCKFSKNICGKLRNHLIFYIYPQTKGM